MMTTWDPAYSLREVQLRAQVEAEQITRLEILESDDEEGYYLIGRPKTGKSQFYLMNYRSRRTAGSAYRVELNRPRLFKNLDRLKAYLRETYPSITRYELTLRADAKAVPLVNGRKPLKKKRERQP
jgi:hypothetical protein